MGSSIRWKEVSLIHLEEVLGRLSPQLMDASELKPKFEADARKGSNRVLLEEK